MFFVYFQIPLACSSAIRRRRTTKTTASVNDSDTKLSISGDFVGEIFEYHRSKTDKIKIFFGQGKICDKIRSMIYSDIMKCRTSMIRCDDYDSVGGHCYYESYYHACETPDQILSVHPRYPEEEHKKPAAPIHLRAFLIALRNKNIDWKEGLIESIKNIKYSKSKSKSKTLISLLEKGHHFSDIAVQLHYGSAIKEKKVKPHRDNNNSLLHIAIGIDNSRSLRLYHHYKNMRKYTDKPQEIGSIYITSSSQFIHSVSYPLTTEQSPIIAIQCRFLMTGQE